MMNPNNRTKGTYLRENWEPIQHQVETFTEYLNVIPEIQMVHTGGHSNDHSIILLKQGNYKFFFYHDQFFTVVEFDNEGKEIVDYVKRIRESRLPFTDKQDRKPVLYH